MKQQQQNGDLIYSNLKLNHFYYFRFENFNNKKGNVFLF